MLGFLGACKDTVLKRPAELTSLHSTEGCAMVVIGMPVWAANAPPAVRQYLAAVHLRSVRIAAFCTYDGSGAEKALEHLAEMTPTPLAARLSLKKPASDPDLDAKLQDWAEQLRTMLKQ